MSDQSQSDDRLEPGGVRTLAVVATAIGFMVLLALSVIILRIIFNMSVTQQGPHAPVVFPAPRVTPNEVNELRHLFAGQRKALSNYRWLNSEHTLAAIPIDRAMQLIARRGAEAYAPIVPTPPKSKQPNAKAPPPPAKASKQGSSNASASAQGSAKPKGPQPNSKKAPAPHAPSTPPSSGSPNKPSATPPGGQP
ncbi:MAG TPA: hypothetical protein VE224_17750 [Pseudolabrys sp.]|nr:hypothetical protein [Pseudolabrys sp.]